MVERVRLAHRVALERSKPKPTPWATIAAEEQIPLRTVQHVHARYLESQSILSDPFRVIEESLELYDASLQRAAELASDPTAQRSVQLGATKVVFQAVKARLELLAALHRLPRDPTAISERERLKMTVERMAGVLEHNMGRPVGPELISDLLACLDSRDSVEGGARELPAAAG